MANMNDVRDVIMNAELDREAAAYDKARDPRDPPFPKASLLGAYRQSADNVLAALDRAGYVVIHYSEEHQPEVRA